MEMEVPVATTRMPKKRGSLAALDTLASWCDEESLDVEVEQGRRLHEPHVLSSATPPTSSSLFHTKSEFSWASTFFWTIGGCDNMSVCTIACHSEGLPHGMCHSMDQLFIWRFC